MISTVEKIIEYGIVGVALWMLYSIAYNHLVLIQTTLVDLNTDVRDLGDVQVATLNELKEIAKTLDDILRK